MEKVSPPGLKSATSVLTVILPALNEEHAIAAALESVFAGANSSEEIEVIVVDGGSTDATVAIATELGANVFSSERGRAVQMNFGANKAAGNMLLFLHADSQLPAGYQKLMSSALQEESRRGRHPQWGCFESIQLDVDNVQARILKAAVGFRTKYLLSPYGDQAIFMQTDLFWEVGGYMKAPLMEDIDLVKKLYKAAGSPAIVSKPVVTSGRRWQRLGFVKTTLLNWSLVCAYKLGANPEQLAKIYYEAGKSGPKQ